MVLSSKEIGESGSYIVVLAEGENEETALLKYKVDFKSASECSEPTVTQTN